MDGFADIRTETGDGVCQIVLNRAQQHNTVRPATLREIGAALDVAVADDAVRAIVLRADGRHFSAGADFGFLDALTRMPATEIKREIYTHFQGAARRLYCCRKPTIAAIAGAAVTVGCELALACDFRIVAEDAYFQESWIKLGIMPPLGGVFLLPRLIGLGRAAQMVLRAQIVRAEEAVRIGLASEIVPGADLQARALEMARELAAMAPLAYATVKEALHRGLETSMEAEWTSNLANQALLLGTEDFREGLASVTQKRAPVFAGR